MKMTSVNLYDEELRPADNDGMKKTAVDQVLGQLAGDGKTHNVKVDLKVKEIWVDESMTPLDRVVTHATISSTSYWLEDDNYTLRYCFNGTLEEHAVRVEDGTLLSDMAGLKPSPTRSLRSTHRQPVRSISATIRWNFLRLMNADSLETVFCDYSHLITG